MKTRWTALPLAALFAALTLWLPATAQGQINFGTISQARSNTIDPYAPDNLGQAWQVTGRVSSVDFKSTFGGTNSVTIYFQDPNDNAGLLLFFPENLEPSFNPATLSTGKQIRVAGFIEQTGFGVTSIRPNVPSINIAITDPTEVGLAPVEITLADLLADPEAYEATFVSVTNATIASGTWPSLGNSGNITINDGTASLTLRIDLNTNLDGQLPPTNAFTAQGIFSQFDTGAAPKDGGYQILPRYYTDIIQDAGDALPDLVITPTNRIVGVGQAAVFELLGRDRNAGDVLTFSAPGAPAGTVITQVTDRVSELLWTPGAGTEGTTNTFDVILSDGANETTGTVQVIVLTAELANIVLNEVHFDPASGAAGDASGDGLRDFLLDEFVEIVNNNLDPVDMSGWTFWYDGVATYTNPPGTVIPGEAALVYFGGPTPVGTFGGATVLWGTNTWPSLSNSGRSISLRTVDGTPVFDLNYNTLPGFDGSSTDQSLTRNPDGTGDFGLHTDANPALLWSPGTTVNGTPFPGSSITNSPPSLTVPAGSVVRIDESIVLQVSGVDPEDDPFTLDVAGAPASALFTDNGDGTGSLVYTGQVADAGTVFTLTFIADDGFGVSSKSSTLTVPSQEFSGLIINEYLANPQIAAPTTGFDANNDGTLNFSDDEFVEIVNNTTGEVNLAGMLLADAVQVRHVFASVSLPVGGVYVVFGGGSLTNFTASPAAVASTGSIGLNNGGDSILLYTPSTTLVDRVDYTASVPGSSETRFPDVTGPFTNHFDLNGQLGSPGRRVDGTPFLLNQSPTLLPIADPAVATGQTLDLVITAIETDGDPVTMTISNAPANSTFMDNGDGTADFSFTPDLTQLGDHEVTFIASDIDGSDELTITISVILVGVGPWDFETSLQGWTTYSRTSNRDWNRVTTGGGAEGTAWLMDINGFGGDGPSDDWLISPALDLDEQGWIDGQLRYFRQYGFDGPVSDLVIYASTEYTGTGDPLAVTWDVVQEVTLPAAENTWAEETADLSAYLSSTNLHVAFRYISIGTGGGESRRWRVDQIYLEGAGANEPPVLSPISDQVVQTGDTLNVPISASEVDGDPVTITISNAPANVVFTDNGDGTADFAFTPTAGQAGQSYTIYITASDKDGADTISFTVDVFSGPLVPGEVWVNEIHYDNDGADVDEGVEIAGPAGTFLDAYTIYLYNGSATSRSVYNTIPLSGVIPNEGDCFGAVWFPIAGIQNGAPDGLALVKDGTNVLEFLSYEGTFVAADGPAEGMESVDIGVEQISSTPIGLTLQRVGSGKQASDFIWAGPTNETRGVLNTAVGQEIVDGCGGGDPDTDGDGIPDWWEDLNFGSITGAVASAIASNGVNTVLETYIADLDPNDPDSVFQLTVEVTAPDIEVRFQSSADRVYTTQYTTNLEADPQVWSDLEMDEPGTGGEKTVLDPSGDVHRAYRARVRLP